MINQYPQLWKKWGQLSIVWFMGLLRYGTTQAELQAEILWTFNIIQYQSPCVITQRTAVFSILSMLSKKLFLITFLKFTSILKFVVLMAKLLTWGKKQISWAWREKGRQLQFRDKFSARKKNHAMNYMLWKITKIKTKRNYFSRADFRKYLVF